MAAAAGLGPHSNARDRAARPSVHMEALAARAEMAVMRAGVTVATLVEETAGEVDRMARAAVQTAGRAGQDLAAA